MFLHNPLTSQPGGSTIILPWLRAEFHSSVTLATQADIFGYYKNEISHSLLKWKQAFPDSDLLLF